MLFQSGMITRLERLRPFAIGWLCGMFCWVWTSQFLLTWGTGFEICAALAATVGIAALLSQMIGRRATQCENWSWLAPAVWTFLTPGILTASLEFMSRQAGERLSDSRIVFLSALVSGLAALAPGLTLAFGLAGTDRRDPRGQSRYWCGIASALFLLPLMDVSWISLQTVSVTAALACAAVFGRRMFGGRPAERSEQPAVEIVLPSLAWPDLLALAVVSLVAGMVMTVTGRLSGELFLPIASLAFAGWAGFALGIAGGLRSRSISDARHLASRSLLLLGLALLLEMALLPGLLRVALMISARVSDLALIFGLRAMMIALLAAPAGLACGWCLSFQSRRSPSSRNRLAGLVVAMWVTAGVLATRWSTLDITSTAPLAAGLLAAAALLRALPFLRHESRSPRRLAVPACTLLAAGAALSLTPETDSLRVLYSPRHLQAFNAGVEVHRLSRTDETRLVRSTHSPDSHWTVWSQGGNQRRILENGVARAVVTIDSDLGPQNTPDVLTAVLPLSLHPEPRRVLVLGVEGPALLAACLANPVEHITAVHGDQAALDINRDILRELWPGIEQGDDRVVWSTRDPVLEAAASRESFNVILAPQSSVAELAAASRHTVEHFRRVAARLTPEGLFCQRLTCFDLGSESLLQLASTLQGAFAHVQLLEIAPGECLFIASQSPVPIDEEFVSRLERRHVRDLLAQAGWDWSIAMSLRMAPAGSLQQLTADVAPHSIRSSRFTMSIPADVMRWAPKYEDRGRWLAAYAHPLGDYLDVSSALDEVRDRLSDVQLAQQVITDYPDQYWAYRKWLKKRLQDRPRSRVIQTAHDGLKNGLHPEDSRRKEYLVVLGRTASTGAERADLVRLAGYATPFDPLVTPFLDRELSVLEGKTPQPDPAAAWRACLRSVNYAPPSDLSVRNVCDSLVILMANPEVVSDPARRWDYMNGLVETLRHRWSARSQSRTDLRYGVADAEATLEAMNRFFPVMDKLRGEVGVSESDWRIRREQLDRDLVRALRSWRANQSARYASTSHSAPVPSPDRLVDHADAEAPAPRDEEPRKLAPQQTVAEPIPAAR